MRRSPPIRNVGLNVKPHPRTNDHRNGRCGVNWARDLPVAPANHKVTSLYGGLADWGKAQLVRASQVRDVAWKSTVIYSAVLSGDGDGEQTQICPRDSIKGWNY